MVRFVLSDITKFLCELFCPSLSPSLHNICLDWGEEDIREEDEGHSEEDEGHSEEGLYEQEEIEGT